MDIQKEREAFEKHASKFFTDSKEAFKTNGDQYLYDEVIWMWDCWIERAKTQAVPEGFVLVPKEPTQQIYRTFYDAFNSANAGNTAQCFKVAYKAMIEAQEPAND
ncbi:hypothetical protein [Acinetobacter sp. YH12086]|uniref:hypothetical protein n=1 Tax=Acinetobacter sp. YH12086 TaxID=2601078 RepID=UPI0015D20E85|nr:hypothetical protein [Acinetobacter sp. YH12086]